MNAPTPRPTITLSVDGRPLQVPRGTSVAAACALAGEADGAGGEGGEGGGATRRSVSGAPRQAFCGMGVCGECRVEVDGHAHRLGCLVACEEGMAVRRAGAAVALPRADGAAVPGAADERPRAEETVDVVVVGAGPAGLAAAEAAAQGGARVVVIDASPRPGGQVWRARGDRLAPEVAASLARPAMAAVEIRTGTRVAMVLDDRRLLLDRGATATASVLRWRRLVIATGARERLLPFPGSTRPGVHGAGGLQALAKGGWPVAGRRVLVAGTGPLLLAAAATLRRAGAIVVEVAEEADRLAVARFGARLALRHGGPLRAALALGAGLLGVPYRAGWRVVEAAGAGEGGAVHTTAGEHVAQIARVTHVTHVTHVTLARADGRTRTVACDALAAGWGLVPQVDLARALGCALAVVRGDDAVQVDADQRTSIDGVFAAGEPTGIAGVAAAIASGRLAGRAAARDLQPRPADPQVRGDDADGADHADHADHADRRALARAHRFADLVAATFPAPADLASRWRDDTLVCRCEDVPWAALRAHDDLRAAKLATRCGMGHCQGRLCHDALARRGPAASAAGAGAAGASASLPGSWRPPLSPMPLSHLLALAPVPDEPPPHSHPDEVPR